MVMLYTIIILASTQLFIFEMLHQIVYNSNMNFKEV